MQSSKETLQGALLDQVGAARLARHPCRPSPDPGMVWQVGPSVAGGLPVGTPTPTPAAGDEVAAAACQPAAVASTVRLCLPKPCGCRTHIYFPILRPPCRRLKPT